MNKLALISDMHLLVDNPVARLDDCKEAGYNKLQYVLDWALENEAAILQAGDVCNKARSWHLLSDLLGIFSSKDKFFCVYGQHDTAMYNEATRKATVLGALAGSGMVRILGDKPRLMYSGEGLNDYYMYGCHYGQEIPVPVEGNPEFNILVIHAPIANEALWQGQDYWDALTFLKKHKKYKLILCGDIHQKFCVEHEGRYIVNAGPMIRREATIYNFAHHPGFWVWGSAGLSWQEIPHVPAEQVLTRDHIEYKQQAITILDEFIKAIKADVSEQGDVSFMANLWAFIRANNLDQGVVEEISKTIGEEKFYKK
jgi:hypothetical protein